MSTSKLNLNKTRLTQLQDNQMDGIIGGIEVGTTVEAEASCKKKSCDNDSSISVEV